MAQASAQAPTVAIPKRLPLVIEPSNRDESTGFDSRLVNAYMESKGSADSREFWIYERPGMDEQSRPPAANATGRGVHYWNGNTYSIFGDKLYKDGVPIAGTVDTTNGVYRFDSSMGATVKLQLGNGVKAYNYDTAGGLVLINDAQFPASFVKGWAYLDGTTYVMTPTAHILGSDINDPVNWNALNDILAQIEPDQGVALNKQLVYVIAFKEWTTEVFYDAGNATGSPLGRVEGHKVNWGCLSANSVQEVNSALIWLGKTRRGSPEIILLDNLQANVVSTKAIERLLQAMTLTTVYSWVLNTSGHRFYVLTFKESNLTLAFDLEERMWSQWTDKDGNYLPIVSSTVNSSGQIILQHESNGRLYIASSNYADDDGDQITVDIYTPPFDGGTRRRKTMAALEIISDQKVGSEMLVRVNDSDYTSNKWSAWRKVDLSQKRALLPNGGTFVKRIYNFRHQKTVRMPRVQGVEMQIDLGTL